jgi:hypothetical protein
MTDPIKHDIEDNAEVVNTILLWRIYDVLSLLLLHADPVDWERLMQAHAHGAFITPQISMTVGTEDV